MSRFNKNDSYFRKAKREGFAARSIYKLEEIDARLGILRKGNAVLDLGCAPGSWLQYAARKVGPDGVVVGVDLTAVKIKLPPHAHTLQQDMYELDLDALREYAPRFDVILSDAAPNTTGIPFADQARSIELVRHSLHICSQLLKRNGRWVAKVFQGEDLPALQSDARARFSAVKMQKPKSSRDHSVEVFLVGTGYRPEGDSEGENPKAE